MRSCASVGPGNAFIRVAEVSFSNAVILARLSEPSDEMAERAYAHSELAGVCTRACELRIERLARRINQILNPRSQSSVWWAYLVPYGPLSARIGSCADASVICTLKDYLRRKIDLGRSPDCSGLHVVAGTPMVPAVQWCGCAACLCTLSRALLRHSRRLPGRWGFMSSLFVLVGGPGAHRVATNVCFDSAVAWVCIHDM